MAPDTLSGPEILLVRYGELSLKGGNRLQFERALVRNIAAQTRSISPVRIERRQGRIAVFPRGRSASVCRKLTDVFGIASVSPARGCEKDPEVIARVARQALIDALGEFAGAREITTRVHTTRGDKTFPMTSTELDLFVADRVLDCDGRLKVQLKRPMLTLGIDVRPERAYVFAARLAGPGGLPVGTQGRALCLISGGIDSPVAAWMAMKRGCRVDFVTFHSPPYIGAGARKKVVDLVQRLSRYQPSSRLWVVPFAEIQVAIRDSRAPPAYRTVLYRRMMQRIATRIAAREGAKALVTGECLGQVASQTIENLTCIDAAAGLVVLRPLIGFDKLEIIECAKRIGTYETSIIHEPDCCTVFLPSRPIIRGRLAACESAERELDVEALIERALAGAEELASGSS